MALNHDVKKVRPQLEKANHQKMKELLGWVEGSNWKLIHFPIKHLNGSTQNNTHFASALFLLHERQNPREHLGT